MSSYDQVYQNRLSQIQALIDVGESSVTRILAQIESASLSVEAIEQNRALKEMEHSRRNMGYAFDGQAVVAKEYDMAVSFNIHRMQVASLIHKYLPADTKRIVELGSGIGANLFWLWSIGAPVDAVYYGYEYARYGSECLDVLASLVRGTRFQSRAFDYRKPDFSAFSDHRPTTVVTVHSLEQIKFVSHELIRSIKEIPGLTRCIHVEPVGYQVKNEDTASCWLDYQNEAWSTLRNSYNRNLVSVLQDLQENREIGIKHVAKHIGGLHAGNAASLIVWDPFFP